MVEEAAVGLTRSFEAQKRYLCLPVRAGAPAQLVTVSVGEAVYSEFQIELAAEEPDWWAPMELGSLRGKMVSLTVGGDEASAALDLVYQSDQVARDATMYREARRPQLRFSSQRGWLNDPNGLVFYRGEYHLFYQHNPYGTTWGNMHWGHAVSADLVHWEELPIALRPDSLGGMFSGSAVVDWNNSADLQDGAEPSLIAIYTAAGKPFSQCIAASSDRGRTWQKYQQNPVLSGLAPQSRDPRVFWYAPDGKWVMALYLDALNPDEHSEITMDLYRSYKAINTFGLFSSPDLKQWTPLSEISLPDDWECPELFEIANGDSLGESRWIFFGAEGRYLVGRFDGERFTAESGPHHLHWGNCFYASQTFNGIDRRILIPWGNTTESPEPVFDGMLFNQSMGIPVELTLRDTDKGSRLLVNPVMELRNLRGAATRIAPQRLTPQTDNPLSGLGGELLEIEADIAVEDSKKLILDIRGVAVTYDVDLRQLFCMDRSGPLEPVDGRVQLRILVDRTAIDIFGNDGELYMPMGVDLSANPTSLSLRAEGGGASIQAVEVHELASIWS